MRSFIACKSLDEYLLYKIFCIGLFIEHDHSTLRPMATYSSSLPILVRCMYSDRIPDCRPQNLYFLSWRAIIQVRYTLTVLGIG
jgi:hypothetical protein